MQDPTRDTPVDLSRQLPCAGGLIAGTLHARWLLLAQRDWPAQAGTTAALR